MFLDDIVGPKPIKESKKIKGKDSCVKVSEGDVIQHKFGIKQAQKGKTPYYKNPDIEIPMYDPARRANYIDGLSKGQPEAYDHFVAVDASPTVSHIVGIAADGTKVKISTANKQLAHVLVDAYNRGGFTDVALQRVPMGEQGVAEGSEGKTPGVALSKAYKKDFDDKKPGHNKPETALTGTYSKTGKPGGELKKQGVAEGSDDKVAKHNAAVSKMTKRSFAKLNYNHPDLLKKAPKGYSFDVSHKLSKQGVAENAEELNVGDPVIIAGPVMYQGATGEIADFGRDKRFVLVNLYNHGKHSFHSSDVKYNDYADSDDEEAHAYDNDPQARDWNLDEDDWHGTGNEPADAWHLPAGATLGTGGGAPIAEYAAGDDNGDGPEDALFHLAQMWYSAPDVATQTQVEQALAKVGWEIGELESEEGGAFVMRIGDESGDSYIGWSEEHLAGGLDEGAPELLKAEMPLVRHIEQELTKIGYQKGTPEFNAYFNDAIKFYRQFGNFGFNKDQGVAEGDVVPFKKPAPHIPGYVFSGEDYFMDKFAPRVFKRLGIKIISLGAPNNDADASNKSAMDYGHDESVKEYYVNGDPKAIEAAGRALEQAASMSGMEEAYGGYILANDFNSLKEQGVAEDTNQPVHRVGLTVTDPNHPMVSRRNETYFKTVRVPGGDQEQAVKRAVAHYRKKGYKVHDFIYKGIADENVSEATGKPLIRKVTKTLPDGSTTEVYELLSANGVTIKTGMSKETAMSLLKHYRQQYSESKVYNTKNVNSLNKLIKISESLQGKK